MENIKHCAVLVQNPEDVYEGSRTALGLAAGNYYGHLFVLDVIVNVTGKLKMNLEWLQEMECSCVSNVKENERQKKSGQDCRVSPGFFMQRLRVISRWSRD